MEVLVMHKNLEPPLWRVGRLICLVNSGFITTCNISTTRSAIITWKADPPLQIISGERHLVRIEQWEVKPYCVVLLYTTSRHNHLPESMTVRWFPRWGLQLQRFIWPFCPKKCMKLKKLDWDGGHATLVPPPSLDSSNICSISSVNLVCGKCVTWTGLINCTLNSERALGIRPSSIKHICICIWNPRFDSKRYYLK